MDIYQLMDLLLENEIKTKETINMVPSENFCSVFSRVPLLLDVYNRYFFNPSADPMQWNFRGAQDVYELETEVAIPLLKNIACAEYVNLRPISGLNCMLLVLNSMGGGAGNSVLLVSPEQGGHYASKQMAESVGLDVDFIAGYDEHNVDFDRLRSQLMDKQYKLIYIDQSNCLFPIDIQQLCKIVREVSPETLVHVDASHWLGLIFGGVIDNPIKVGADSFGGTTHKTFPGPQRAVFCTNDINLHKNFADSQFYMISSHHFGSVISLAISLMEFQDNNGLIYAEQIIKNSKKLATLLDQRGYDVKGKKYGFTSGHQIWLSSNNLGIDSYDAGKLLFDSGIRVNSFDELPGSIESILRIGVNEITRFGATEADMDELSDIMDSAIKQTVDNKKLNQRVRALKQNLSSPYQYKIDNKLLSQIESLLSEAFDIQNKNILIHS